MQHLDHRASYFHACVYRWCITKNEAPAAFVKRIQHHRTSLIRTWEERKEAKGEKQFYTLSCSLFSGSFVHIQFPPICPTKKWMWRTPNILVKIVLKNKLQCSLVYYIQNSYPSVFLFRGKKSGSRILLNLLKSMWIFKGSFSPFLSLQILFYWQVWFVLRG